MTELLLGAASGVAVAAATVLVAWMNSRSAARQSSIGTYEQLVNQVTEQQDQMAKMRELIDRLYDEQADLKLEMIELKAANARWAKWAESLVVDWPERRQRHDPPELPRL